MRPFASCVHARPKYYCGACVHHHILSLDIGTHHEESRSICVQDRPPMAVDYGCQETIGRWLVTVYIKLTWGPHEGGWWVPPSRSLHAEHGCLRRCFWVWRQVSWMRCIQRDLTSADGARNFLIECETKKYIYIFWRSWAGTRKSWFSITKTIYNFYKLIKRKFSKFLGHM